jgi:dipeptidyl aminopeptidase/acylaminoacyl peptidase
MTRRFLGALLVAAAALSPACPVLAQEKASDIPVETFVRRAENTQMTLSPNGQLLAALTPVNGRDNLVVIDLRTKTKSVITSLADYDVVDFTWVSDTRLFFRVADGRDALGTAQYAGAYAIDVDGRDIRDLNRIGARVAPLRRKSADEMYVSMALRRRDAVDPYVLNTRTGRFEILVEEAPADTRRWILDWKGVPRVAVSVEPSAPKTVVWYREDAKSPWVKLSEHDAGLEDVEQLIPIAFTEDNQQLYVSSNIGRDRYAIFKYDPKARKLGEVVFEHPLVDLRGGLAFNRAKGQLEGIRYDADRPGAAWVSEDLARLQQQVDAALPHRANTLVWGEDNRKRFLVHTRSDVDPGRYYLLETEPKLAMEEIVEVRPWIKPSLMSEVKYMPYKARDGLQVPAWVTLPKDSAGRKVPLVVHVHGGPWGRSYGWGRWTRYSENQLFASRGYAVLEAEPRASSGFGRNHLVAGYKQFGQAMQDDLTDGVKALVAAGLVDKDRVCIYGGSYGGYASLWGPIKDPELYRCAIPWIAVTDLALWQTATWTDFAQNRRYNFDPEFARLVGSAKTERDFLDKYSPYLHADRIRIPILLVMGEDDRRVPIEHGTKMKDALDRAGVKNTYVILPREGHGFNKDENVVDFFRRVEKFLAENLK